MKKAVIDGTGKVVNIAIVRDDWTNAPGEWSPPEDHQVIDAGEGGPGDTWDGGVFNKSVIESAELWATLRKHRNTLLASTDWWSLSDSPTMTEAQTIYRAALRDLPANTEDPNAPVWPILS